MKKYSKIVIALLLLIVVKSGFSQTFNPTQSITVAKPLAISSSGPLDARSMMYDMVNFLYRPYRDTAEVNAYLNLPKYRTGKFTVFIQAGGTLNSNGTFTGGQLKEYWYKNGTASTDLVEKTSNAGFTDLSNLSLWGVDTLGLTDNTVQVNLALDWAAASTAKTLYVNGKVRVDGRLSYSRKHVNLIGTGKLLSKERLNFGELEVGNPASQFSGLINRNYNSFPKTAAKIYGTDTVNIVVWGNSITSGYDYILGKGGYTPSSFNQSDRTSSWYEQFIKEMEKNFSGRPIKIFNRSAAGFALSDFTRNLIDFSPQSAVQRFMTTANQNSSWVLSVKDCNPDLIILSLGMNDAPNYLENAIALQSELNTWQKVPEMVLLSTPASNYTYDQTYGDMGGAYRVDKFTVSNEQMFFADLNKYYVIDVARQQDIKRYGTDYRNYVFKPTDGFSWTADAGVTTTGTSVSFPAGTKKVKINRYNKTPDYAMEFTYRQNGSVTDWTISDSLYSIIKVESGTVYMYPYVKVGVNSEGVKTAVYTFTNGVNYNIRVELGSKAMSFYVNDALVVRTPLGTQLITDPFLKITGAASTVAVTNFVLYDAVYNKYRPSLTGTDIWGDGVNTNNGNGINHPSQVGVNSIYNPPVREFVADLYQSSVINATRVTGSREFIGDSVSIGLNSKQSGKGTLDLFPGTFNKSGSVVFRTPTGRRIGTIGYDTSRISYETTMGAHRFIGGGVESDGSISAGILTTGLGRVAMHQGTFANSGYLEIFSPGQVRVGTVGYDSSNLSITAERGNVNLVGNMKTTGTITTFQPPSGTPAAWNLGSRVGDSIQVAINGISVWIPTTSKGSYIKAGNNITLSYVGDTVVINSSSSGWVSTQFTTGTTYTVPSASSNYLVVVNPTSTLSNLSITLPAGYDYQQVRIVFGGTISSGVVVSSLTVVGTLGGSKTFTDVAANEDLNFLKTSFNSAWYRINK